MAGLLREAALEGGAHRVERDGQAVSSAVSLEEGVPADLAADAPSEAGVPADSAADAPSEAGVPADSAVGAPSEADEGADGAEAKHHPSFHFSRKYSGDGCIAAPTFFMFLPKRSPFPPLKQTCFENL